MLVRLFTAVFLVANVVATGSVGATGTKTSMWFDSPREILEGARLIDSGETQKGMAMTRNALELNLDLYAVAVVHTNLCAGYLQLKQYRQAIAHCDKALAIRPGQWQALNNRGGAYYGLAEYDQAAGDYTQALTYRPDNADLETNLEMVRREQ